MPAMVGGVFYEHGHRLVATVVGFLTIVVALWVGLRDRRRWMKWLGVVALLAVTVQGVLGGLTVLYFLPPPVSTLHAFLAQLYFCLIVSMAVFASPGWNRARPTLEDAEGISLRTLSSTTVGFILAQLFLGAAFRHQWFSLIPHVVGAALVTAVVIWTVVAVRRRFPEEPFLMRPAWTMVGLLAAQLVLGPLAYYLMWTNADSPQPLEPMIGVTVAHVVVGALTLAAALVLTLRVFRVLPARRRTAEQSSWAQTAQHHQV